MLPKTLHHAHLESSCISGSSLGIGPSDGHFFPVPFPPSPGDRSGSTHLGSMHSASSPSSLHLIHLVYPLTSSSLTPLTCPDPLPTKEGHSHWALQGLSHKPPQLLTFNPPLRGVQGGDQEGGTLCSRKTREQAFT